MIERLRQIAILQLQLYFFLAKKGKFSNFLITVFKICMLQRKTFHLKTNKGKLITEKLMNHCYLKPFSSENHIPILTPSLRKNYDQELWFSFVTMGDW